MVGCIEPVTGENGLLDNWRLVFLVFFLAVVAFSAFLFNAFFGDQNECRWLVAWIGRWGFLLRCHTGIFARDGRYHFRPRATPCELLQVKIRGVRVEPEEVEAVLRRLGVENDVILGGKKQKEQWEFHLVGWCLLLLRFTYTAPEDLATLLSLAGC